MPRKVFTAGEVLAAADVNSFLMDQTVMTFAGTAARGSAITTPVEGMVTYLEDSNSFEYWDSAEWDSLVPPSPSGLVHIRTESFSGVSSVIADGVFTSTFKNYRVIIRTTTTASPRVRFRSGGSDETGSVYQNNAIFNDAGINTNISTNTDLRISNAVVSTTNSLYVIIDIFGANLAENTFTIGTFRSQIPVSGITTDIINTITQYDGVQLFPVSGTISGQMIIFGVKE